SGRPANFGRVRNLTGTGGGDGARAALDRERAAMLNGSAVNRSDRSRPGSAKRRGLPDRSLLHAAQDLVLPSFADPPIVLPRLVEAQVREVAHEQQHEDDGDVVGDGNDRPEVRERTHAGTTTRAHRGGQRAATCRTGRSPP